MKAWYESLQERERLLLLGGSLLLGLMLLYLLVWEPLQRDVRNLEAAVHAARGQVSWMQQASAEATALKGRAPGTAPSKSRGSLINAVEQSAGQAGLRQAIQRMEPQGSDKIILEFREVAFDHLITWLGSLEQRYAAHVSQFNATRSPSPGRVDARVILERNA